MASGHRIRVVVNSRPFEREVEPRLLLSDFLRETLALRGTHVGCEHGVCGSCTVLVDGLPARSCLMLAVQVEGSRVETVESLAEEGRLHVLQEAFRECHALQCGFCTPGILMTLKYVLQARPGPEDEESFRGVLSGNLCRCTGYQNIVKAARLAAQRMRGTNAARESGMTS